MKNRIWIQFETIIITFFLCFVLSTAKSQDCSSNLIIKLNRNEGGVFISQKVTLVSKVDGSRYEQNTNNDGEVNFTLPCNTMFEVLISNYTSKIQIQTRNGGTYKKTLTYSASMVENEKMFALTPEEKSEVDKAIQLLPDSIEVYNPKMNAPKDLTYYVAVTIKILDIYNKPLADERIVFKGLKRNKKIIGSTDSNGKLMLYIPKGDSYTMSFKYHQNYSFIEYNYTKGISEVNVNLSYLGTKEVERRKKEETLRIAELEKRIKEERERFELDCKKKKISLEEGYRLEWEKMRKDYKSDDNIIIDVLNRNKWLDKLIVCDLTGSMEPYIVQLSIWYQLNFKKEKNLQFVFFNDGDSKTDDEKVIGETGGIYYSPSKGLDSLGRLMSKITARGSGGDCAENNIEALIKGSKMASQYKEIVMIVDNNSPIKDIKLLDQFKKPVHIILCGATEGWILADYLLLAWKTKGTIHTIEEDITSIAKMSEGQEIKIGKCTYKIMGGEFVRIVNT